MSEIVSPAMKHPKGHCWNVLQHHPHPRKRIARLETTYQCRAWLAKMNELGVDPDLKRAVSQRYQELDTS